MKAGTKLFSFSLVLALILVGFHEYYFRIVEGYSPSYDTENVDYWADQRAKVKDLTAEDVIIIGSSRAHFDFNIHLWDSITGRRPLMLAYQGSNPLLVLDDLVKRSEFNGLLVVGVSPGLFFSQRESWPSGRIKKGLDQYYDRTYAQALNHHLFKFFDANLGYVDSNITLKNLINGIPFPPRDSVETDVIWPPFIQMDKDRNIRMFSIMEEDTIIQKRQKDIWFNPDPKNRDADSIEVILKDYEQLVKDFKIRGGKIAFVRPPVTGYYLETEPKLFPKSAYWDTLIELCDCPGYHFADHPSTKDMQPPEWSHLSRKDSDIYTKTIIEQLKQDKLL